MSSVVYLTLKESLLAKKQRKEGEGVIIFLANNNGTAVSEFDITRSKRCKARCLHDALFGANSMQRFGKKLGGFLDWCRFLQIGVFAAKLLHVEQFCLGAWTQECSTWSNLWRPVLRALEADFALRGAIFR
ncbi:hypothetical protein ACFPT7_18135 [Acidicapsa dinghuensis]|uniref:Uncharacterized protein n=1 Tax=Acidicapsa dinghuensis TaxID=2218256 RepID=A0ABW1EJ59_9BACT|nr:hypothetical protein [Acidicapsa dinghuensis]